MLMVKTARRLKMSRKISDEISEEELQDQSQVKENKDEIDHLNRMLAAVLTYLSDEEVEEIDIEYLLNNTEGLREWWDQYREKNRKQIEDEIKLSLANLPLEELESIREKIKENIQ
jgi:hypothetical protein